MDVKVKGTMTRMIKVMVLILVAVPDLILIRIESILY